MKLAPISNLFNDNLYWIIPLILIALTFLVSPLWNNVLVAWLLVGTVLIVVMIITFMFCEIATSFMPELKVTLEEEFTDYKNSLIKLREFNFKSVVALCFIGVYAYYGWWICFSLASFNLFIPKAFASFAKEE